MSAAWELVDVLGVAPLQCFWAKGTNRKKKRELLGNETGLIMNGKEADAEGELLKELIQDILKKTPKEYNLRDQPGYDPTSLFGRGDSCIFVTPSKTLAALIQFMGKGTSIQFLTKHKPSTGYEHSVRVSTMLNAAMAHVNRLYPKQTSMTLKTMSCNKEAIKLYVECGFTAPIAFANANDSGKCVEGTMRATLSSEAAVPVAGVSSAGEDSRKRARDEEGSPSRRDDG